MTGSDLIWIAPWVIFGVCLAVVCARLLSPRLHLISTRCRRFLHIRRRT